MSAAAILDVDGTLVDSNYHHALAWWRALRQHGATVPLWRIHRLCGMGGGRIVATLMGDDFDREHGDDVRAAEAVLWSELMAEVVPLDGARRLLDVLHDGGLRVVLASSAKSFEIEHYIDLLGVRELADAWTDSSDVEETKPHPELVSVALERVGAAEGVMIGDSTFDCAAAAQAGVASVALLTGGFGEDELRAAGASAVFASIAALIAGLDDTPVGALMGR